MLGARRAHCCLGRALASFPSAPRHCLVWEVDQERELGGEEHTWSRQLLPSQGPSGAVATVARHGHQVQLSGNERGFPPGIKAGAKPRLGALIRGGSSGGDVQFPVLGHCSVVRAMSWQVSAYSRPGKWGSRPL